MNSQTPPSLSPNTPPTRKKRHGCLWAILITFVLAILVVIAGYFVIRGMIKSAIQNYTATTGTPLPEFAVTDAEASATGKRLQAYFDELGRGQAVGALVLTADDLNRLVALTGTNALRGRLFVSITNGAVQAWISAPLEKVAGGTGGLHDRWLNAQATLKISFDGNELRIWADDLRANDRPLPGWLMTKLRERNFAESLMNNQDAWTQLQRLDSIIITNDTLVLQPK